MQTTTLPPCPAHGVNPHREIPTLTPQSREQKRRIDALVKQAADALYLLSEERLNLDIESRNVLNEARQLVSSFDYVVSQQPLAVFVVARTQETGNPSPVT